MKEWSHKIRQLGNRAAHPKDGEARPSGRDARDLVQFLDFFLEYAYTLPRRMAQYRQHAKEESDSSSGRPAGARE